MNKNNKYNILFSCFLIVFIIITTLVSCSNSKVLIKDEKIQDMLAKEEISYDYTLENGLVINKIYDKNEINGYTIESTESFCLYLVDKLNLENKGIVYETYNNSYESYLKIKQDETIDCNISICDTRKNYGLFEYESNTINITEKNYFLNVFFSNAMAQYTSILPSFTFIYVDSGEYVFLNQMYVDILCGDFYINIVGNIDYELLGIFGIEQEEYEENKLNFVFPMKKIIIDKEIDKNKLLQFINEHEEMKVGKYTSDVSTNHTYVIFDFLLINLYKSNEEQLICIDNEKHALYGFDFIDDGFFIPSKLSNFETRGAGIIIYFNNSVCYSITDDIFDVIPYICSD